VKKAVCFLFSLLLVVPLSANLSAVMPDRLPKDDSFARSLGAFIENAKYMNHRAAEWRYPVCKDDLVRATMVFEKKIGELNPGNADYELSILDLVVLQYLDNLGAPIPAGIIDARAAWMKKTWPDEYRTWWIYGNYLVGTAKTVSGINEYRQVTDRVRDLSRLQPAFLEDYAYGCLLSFMNKNGLVALETAERLRNLDPASSPIWPKLKRQLRTPDVDGTFERTTTWNIQKGPDGFRMFSHLLGASIPLDAGWALRYTGYEGKRSEVTIEPAQSASTGGVAVRYLFSAEGESLADYGEKAEKSLPVTERTSRQINGITWTVLRYGDGTDGGSCGYCLFSEIPVTSASGLGIEFPYMVDASTVRAKSSWYALRDGYDRIGGPLIVGISLEARGDLFAQSEPLFWDIVGRTVLE